MSGLHCIALAVAELERTEQSSPANKSEDGKEEAASKGSRSNSIDQQQQHVAAPRVNHPSFPQRCGFVPAGANTRIVSHEYHSMHHHGPSPHHHHMGTMHAPPSGAYHHPAAHHYPPPPHHHYAAGPPPMYHHHHHHPPPPPHMWGHHMPPVYRSSGSSESAEMARENSFSANKSETYTDGGSKSQGSEFEGSSNSTSNKKTSVSPNSRVSGSSVASRQSSPTSTTASGVVTNNASRSSPLSMSSRMLSSPIVMKIKDPVGAAQYAIDNFLPTINSGDNKVKHSLSARTFSGANSGDVSGSEEVTPAVDTEVVASAEAVTSGADADAWETEHLEEVMQVREFDVLCGRGGETNHHSGNIQYRQFVKLCQPAYISAKRREKPKISEIIVQAVRNLGGRFLKKNIKKTVWQDIGNVKAREKTSQALREGAPELRNTNDGSTMSSTPVAAAVASAAVTLTTPKRRKKAVKPDSKIAATPEATGFCHVKSDSVQPSPSSPRKRSSDEMLCSTSMGGGDIGGSNGSNNTSVGIIERVSPMSAVSATVVASSTLAAFESPRTTVTNDEESSHGSTPKATRGPRLKLLKKRLECDIANA